MFLLGVNEAVVDPPRLLAEAGDAPTPRLVARADRAASVGARAVRVQAGRWPNVDRAVRTGDFARTDAAFALLAERGLDAVVVLAPWPANAPWQATDDCRLDAPEAWAAGVTAFVERYDGDGVADAPGARPVVAWEVDNEPDLHETLRPGFCPADAHAATLATTAAAVRAADPDAIVLNGGVYRPATVTGLSWMRAVAAGGVALGGASIHLYAGADAVERLAAAITHTRDAFGPLPIWVTETSTTGEGDGTGRRGEAEQARALVELALAARDAGVAAWFWHNLLSPPEPPRGGGVPVPGLFTFDGDDRGPDAWREKPAATAYAAVARATGPVGGDGDLSWVDVGDGWLVWPRDAVGVGRPPGAPRGFAGGAARPRGERWRVRGLAFVPR